LELLTRRHLRGHNEDEGGEVKDIVEAIVFGIVAVLICPLGWIGLLCLAMVIEAIKG